MARNPFEVFGITPEMAGDLTEKELFGVIKSLYRALLKTFHPDANRSSKRQGDQKAVELNLAFEAINLDRDPASFRSLRKAYLTRQPAAAFKHAFLLKNQLNLQLERESVLADNFLSYLAQDAKRPGETQDKPSLVKLTDTGLRLGLLDVAINNNIRQASWVLGANYKQMEISLEGILSVKAVGRRRYSRANFIRLLGCVPTDRLDIAPLLEKTPEQFFRYPALSPGVDPPGPKPSVLNLISQDNFKRHVLKFLEPFLLERAYLFSLNKAEFSTTGHISLEGVIVKLDYLTKTTNPAPKVGEG
ncbi:MAG: J domain-containing protein [Deltaproteobacteria bacterium]|nr:J domain-containing protein [Deltaproteobacteria bacterium]